MLMDGVDISLDYRHFGGYVKGQFAFSNWRPPPTPHGIWALTLLFPGDITAPNMNPVCIGMSMSTTTSRNGREVFVVGPK